MTASREKIPLTCLHCESGFLKPRHREQDRVGKGQSGPFCSRRCGNAWRLAERERSPIPSPVPSRAQEQCDPAWFSVALRDAARFWSRVDRSGACWIWTAGVDKDGYGKFTLTLPRIGGKQQQVSVRAHRIAYLLTVGPLAGDQLVRHSCDTPACCNPKHLEPGSQVDNVADRVARGRSARGESHGRYRRAS